MQTSGSVLSGAWQGGFSNSLTLDPKRKRAVRGALRDGSKGRRPQDLNHDPRTLDPRWIDMESDYKTLDDELDQKP